jgi:hypothetical protein
MSKNISKFVYKDLSILDIRQKDDSNLTDYNDYSSLSGAGRDASGNVEQNHDENYVDLKNNHIDEEEVLDANYHSTKNIDNVDSITFSEDGVLVNKKIEQIKKEAYDSGYEDCKLYMEKIISEYKINNNIVETLDNKIKEINILEDRTQEMFSFCVEMLKLIASKLYVSASTDFEKVLVEIMFKYVKKNFKGNKIEIVVHPNKVGYSNNVLQLQDLPEKIKNHVSISGEDDLGIDDCYIKYEDTVLKYDRLSIEQEIDEVLSRL